MTWWLAHTKTYTLIVCFVCKCTSKQRDQETVCWPIGLVAWHGCPTQMMLSLSPRIPLSIGNIPRSISWSCLSTACESAARYRLKLPGSMLTIKQYRQSSPSLNPVSLHLLCPHIAHSQFYLELKRNNLSNTLVRLNILLMGKFVKEVLALPKIFQWYFSSNVRRASASHY